MSFEYTLHFTGVSSHCKCVCQCGECHCAAICPRGVELQWQMTMSCVRGRQGMEVKHSSILPSLLSLSLSMSLKTEKCRLSKLRWKELLVNYSTTLELALLDISSSPPMDFYFTQTSPGVSVVILPFFIGKMLTQSVLKGWHKSAHKTKNCHCLLY